MHELAIELSLSETEREIEMGKMDHQDHQHPAETVIHHFSHSHTLQLSHHHHHLHHQPQFQTLSPAASCAGCKLKASGLMYSCKPCNYFLHISCSRMPQEITHSFHTAHPLSLFPNPAYPEGLFNCDACGNPGNGFSYHCTLCNIDLHILCAFKPLLLTHQSHHHQLALSFSPPYPNKSFSCDICRQIGSNHWLYRCQTCEFDAHLSCACSSSTTHQDKPAAPIQTASPAGGNYMRQLQQQYSRTTTVPQPTTTLHGHYFRPPQASAVLPFHVQSAGTGQNHPAVMNQVSNLNPAGVYGPVRRPATTSSTGRGNSFLSQAIDDLVNGAAQQLGMSMVQGFQGGGGGASSWDGGSSSMSYDYYSTGTDGGSVDFQDTSY